MCKKGEPDKEEIMIRLEIVAFIPLTIVCLNKLIQSAMSSLVKEMNSHIGNALKLIEAGCADNNEQIRHEIKQFFTLAEQIQKMIAQNEVSSINNVKYNELIAIQQQKQQIRTRGYQRLRSSSRAQFGESASGIQLRWKKLGQC